MSNIGADVKNDNRTLKRKGNIYEKKNKGKSAN